MSAHPLLEALADRHPWLRSELEETAAHTYARSWTLPVDRETAWTALSDTSRLNRALRIPAARFDEEGGCRVGTSEYFGRAFRWTEPPWEWVRPQLFLCRKNFESGPMASMFSVIELEEQGAETRVNLWYGWRPRGMLGPFLTNRVVSYLQRGFTQVMPSLVDSFSAEGPSPLVRPPRSRVPAGEARRGELEQALRAQTGPLGDRLVQHVYECDPLELDRIRPFALADAWNTDRTEVLLAHLEATRAGLLLARWDVLCPHCRGVRASLASLDALASTASCEACEVLFETGGSAMELTFRVHPSVRSVEKRVYCAAEPSTKPHIDIQLCNRQERTVAAPARAGRYLVRHDGEELGLRVDEEGPAEARLPEQQHVQPGGALTFPATEQRWVVERVAPTTDAVQPRHVLSLDAYRAVMGSEALAADLALEIGVQALLFTDVVGSTQLYRDLGDRDAFEAVRRHFSVVSGLVQAEGGALIKTIGDAVMAAFTTPEAAARAAKQIVNSDLGDIRVRLSLHSGPCIAVNLDTGLDYFGAVVNEAAKLQGAAGAGEVAMSEEMAQRLGVTGPIATYASGPLQRRAVVWRPVDTSTPAGVRRVAEPG